MMQAPATIRPAPQPRTAGGWLRRVFSADHRVVGFQYLIAGGAFFLLGGLLALLVRWKLAWPQTPVPVVGEWLGWPGGVLPAEFYAQAFTMHATVMIWLVVVPVLAWGLGLFAMPELVGSNRLALPKLGGLSFWWMLVGAAVLLVGWSGAGWTAYAPLSNITGSRWIPLRPDAAGWLRITTSVDGFPMQSPWSAAALYGVFGALALLLVYVVAQFVPGPGHGLSFGPGLGTRSSKSRGVRWLMTLVQSALVVALAWLGTIGFQYLVFDGQTAWFFAVFWWASGGLMAALPILVTVLTRWDRIRVPRLPLGAWGWATTAAVGLFAGPVLLVAMVLNGLDAHGLTSFFRGEGGQPLLHQHLFWFYGHPVVYLMILPAFGLVSDVLAAHSSRPIYGYRMMAGTTVAIGLLGFMVWAHHMFQSGLNPSAALVFSAATLLIAVPSAMKTVGWLGTIWGGGLRMTAAMWGAMAFVSLFILGGLSGVVLAAPAINLHLHDTYFVVAHLHYTLFGGSIFGIFTGLYFFWPKLTGRPLNERLGKWHLLLTYLAFNATFGAMHVLGAYGMPRRYADPSSIGLFERFAGWQTFMTLSAFVLGAAQLLLLINILWSPRRRDATAEPE